MKISAHAHLSYCTNIHPGEHWVEVWDSLKQYTLPLKQKISPDKAMGIGLRLSHIASQEILEADQLQQFKDWLIAEDLYVFTMNGFPYGGFHRTHVKDDVHKPDWTTDERLSYTKRLFDILSLLLPDGTEGGISSSPLSYRYWFEQGSDAHEDAWSIGVENLTKLAIYLHEMHQQKGQFLHIDIEPEPDGFLENTEEVVDFYNNRLIPFGTAYIQNQLGITKEEATQILYDHIQVCYDVCHFAVVFEKPAYTFERWAAEGIKIGKVQISAALKAEFPKVIEDRSQIIAAFEQLNESTYLHQVVARHQDGHLSRYRDLPDALPIINDPTIEEWRTHFHVPIFIERYDHLQSTRSSIEAVLAYPTEISKHWEVETYTWEVLPKRIRFDLADSIEKELRWVMENWNAHV